MINVLPVISFFIFLWGLGSFFINKNCKFLERISVGLAAVPVIGLILNTLHIPIDWRIFLGLSMLIPCFQLIKTNYSEKIKSIKFSRPSWQAILVIAVFIFAIAIYCWGSFQYPWLEDDDPWSHAASIKYVAIEKNLNAADGTFQYINPYPPGYAIVFGLLHQVNPSIYWTMKFFNGLIICFGFLFFYLFAQELTQNKSKAALATFFLVLIPCYLTHFIWAHSLVIALMFPSFYFMIKSFRDKNYIVPAATCCAALTLTQPTQPIKFAVMAMLLIWAFRSTKIYWKNVLSAISIAAIISLLWWGPIIFNASQGRSKLATRVDNKITATTADTLSVFKGIFSPTLGTATQPYSWEHFVFIPNPNLINNPVSLTPIICIIAFIGILFGLIKIFSKKTSPHERSYVKTVFLWLIFTFLGINSMTFHLPLGLFAFRFWMLFAIPVSLFCAEGLCSFAQSLQIKPNKILIVALFIFATIRSTLPFKWRHNTNEWSYGVHWTSREDIEGYVWMRKTLPVNAKVFSFTDNILVLGHDMRADFWSEDYRKHFSNAFGQTVSKLYTSLSKKNYEYLIISPRDIREFGVKKVKQKIKNLYDNRRFRLIFTNKAVKIFQILK